MENDAGEFVDLYVPRKWYVQSTLNLIFVLYLNFFSSASNRIIHAKDHASIQLAIAEVDPTTGVMTQNVKSYTLCGNIRRMGESDDSLVRLAKDDGIVAK